MRAHKPLGTAATMTLVVGKSEKVTLVVGTSEQEDTALIAIKEHIWLSQWELRQFEEEPTKIENIPCVFIDVKNEEELKKRGEQSPDAMWFCDKVRNRQELIECIASENYKSAHTLYIKYTGEALDRTLHTEAFKNHRMLEMTGVFMKPQNQNASSQGTLEQYVAATRMTHLQLTARKQQIVNIKKLADTQRANVLNTTYSCERNIKIISENNIREHAEFESSEVRLRTKATKNFATFKKEVEQILNNARVRDEELSDTSDDDNSDDGRRSSEALNGDRDSDGGRGSSEALDSDRDSDNGSPSKSGDEWPATPGGDGDGSDGIGSDGDDDISNKSFYSPPTPGNYHPPTKYGNPEHETEDEEGW